MKAKLNHQNLKTLPCLVCKKEQVVLIEKSKTPRIEKIFCGDVDNFHHYNAQLADDFCFSENILYGGYYTEFEINHPDYGYGTLIMSSGTSTYEYIGFYPDRIEFTKRDEIIQNFLMLL